MKLGMPLGQEKLLSRVAKAIAEKIIACREGEAPRWQATIGELKTILEQLALAHGTERAPTAAQVASQVKLASDRPLISSEEAINFEKSRQQYSYPPRRLNE